jgi:Transposase DDE domain group 1
MATECYTQLGFGFQPKLVVDFAGGTLTSDAGLMLVREFDERWGLTADVSRRLTDARDRRYVTHPATTLLRQRLYQIVAGYEDTNDATRLRDDPIFQVVASRNPATLGSQPTLSRWEHAADWTSIRRLSAIGVEWFCAHAFGRRTHPAELILDVDGTDDRTHGAQQLALFNGYYRERVYHLLVWSEGVTGLPLRTRLRPGEVHGTTGLLPDLHQLLPPLRRRFPDTRIRLRGDAGLATAAVEQGLEDADIDYVLGIGPHQVFQTRIAACRARAEARYARTQRPVAVRTSFWHRARRWPVRRRILVKLDVTATGTSLRFMVTNRTGRAADLITWYEGRGAAENIIKELKLDLHADRLSCQRYRPNALRLQLHTIAQLLLSYFRRAILRGTPWRQATVATIRLHLLKAAARIRRSVRHVWVHVASHWPGESLFRTCHATLAQT